MSALELAIWSAAGGAVALVVLICVADFAMVRSRAAAQGAAYNVAALFFILLLSGLPRAVLPDFPAAILHAMQVLIGPLCVFVGDFWVRAWLAARQRDRL